MDCLFVNNNSTHEFNLFHIATIECPFKKIRIATLRLVDIHYSHMSPTQLKITQIYHYVQLFQLCGQVSSDKGQLPRTHMLVVIESML
jgi:hypothetical protein